VTEPNLMAPQAPAQQSEEKVRAQPGQQQQARGQKILTEHQLHEASTLCPECGFAYWNEEPCAQHQR